MLALGEREEMVVVRAMAMAMEMATGRLIALVAVAFGFVDGSSGGSRSRVVDCRADVLLAMFVALLCV